MAAGCFVFRNLASHLSSKSTGRSLFLRATTKASRNFNTFPSTHTNRKIKPYGCVGGNINTTVLLSTAAKDRLATMANTNS
uniref:Uncharacterized protein n=2 Tax=Oryza brachyantha TaxID=4533 RepID=J3MIU0_ORYBR